MYKIKLSRSELAALNKRRKQEKNKALTDRLQCIYLANTGHTHKEIAAILGSNKNSVTNWIKIYQKKGLDELCRPENFDRRSSPFDRYIEHIKQDIRDKTISTLAELQDWIKKEYSLELEQSWLWRCCKKNSICLTKRPV
jgi:transposase